MNWKYLHSLFNNPTHSGDILKFSSYDILENFSPSCLFVSNIFTSCLSHAIIMSNTLNLESHPGNIEKNCLTERFETKLRLLQKGSDSQMLVVFFTLHELIVNIT